MKILTYRHKQWMIKTIEELKRRMGSAANHSQWTCYDDISCLCLPDKLFAKFREQILSYQPQIEEDLQVKIHAESTEEIPWGVKYMKVNKLWKKGMGHGVKIAVIDTGISRKHFELRERVKGGIHLVGGYANGHGTHVAGIIVAEANNRGIVGISPKADLYDVKAFGNDGTAKLVNIIKGLDWCIKNRMDIVNMSFGMPQYSEALARTIKRAAAQGMLLVASAGNNGATVEYPARFNEVIGVGAIRPNGKLASFSARGKGMNATAPGVDILSTWPGNQFKRLNGTSMAAPHVTGLLALQLSNKRQHR